MTSNPINIAIAIGVVIYVVYRRMSWNPWDNKEIWGGPLTLLAIGLIQMRHMAKGLSGTDVGFLVAGLAVSLLGGAVMGAVTQIDRRGDTIYQRIGWLGLGAWIGLLVVRGVLGVIGHFAGATQTSGGGAILLSLGANLLTMSLVLAVRTGTPITSGSTARH